MHSGSNYRAEWSQPSAVAFCSHHRTIPEAPDQIEAEREEREFYQRRAPKEWLAALVPLGTDEHKPYLETAPFLIAIFLERYGKLPDGRQVKHYYPTESVGIATGILIAAIQHVGLVSLTHTPSPMKFLNEILKRPTNESCFLLLVVGYPAEDAVIPDITRKEFEDVCTLV
jgi:iodotyrosine deiodinase